MRRGAYRCTSCPGAEHGARSPTGSAGHGAPTPVWGPAGAAAVGGDDPGDAAGDAATAPGEVAPEGEPAGAGEVACGAGEELGLCFATGEAADAAPCGAGEAAGLVPPAGDPAGAAAPVGEGLACSAGARAPIFARSWPIRIFPRSTCRSKM